jgi:membrane fusion protein, copper/silver efflux system
MKRLLYPAIVLALVAAAYFIGSRRAQPVAGTTPAPPARRILYYVDPMNPAHTSDKPGKAPCGMEMEPVWADEPAGAASGAFRPLPGTVRIPPEKQQLIGVQTGVVERKQMTHALRLLGRVAVDETRTYRINATVDGWINQALPFAAGSRVKKDETLATFYSPEFLSAGQALLFALNSMDRVQTTGKETPGQQSQMEQFNLNLKQYADSLRNLGMGESQIQEMIRTRKYMENINITAPGDGFIVARNVSQGQRFDKGTELYRIADLSRVWILADVFEYDARLVQPGAKARVSLPNQNVFLAAAVSEALPQFDSTTRTLKLRLEADNPDFLLKPDMFVDVELPVSLSESLVVPADAVFDTGLRKTVFVDRGNGYFEPRAVRTGERTGGEIQILQGLMAGERIAISGNFMLDSESRMKLAASGIHGEPAIDPVCGMAVDENKARAEKRQSDFEGKTYFFCNDGCKQEFDANPGQYLGEAKSRPAPVPEAQPARAADPVCGMMVDEAKARAANRLSEYLGKTYFFCNDGCKKEFDTNPEQFLKAGSPAPTMSGHSMGDVATNAPAHRD